MNPKFSQPWIPLSRIEKLVQLEPALVIVGLAFGAWVSYKILLRAVSPERHRNLKAQFSNLSLHLLSAILLFFAYTALHRASQSSEAFERAATYVGLVTLLAGVIVFVKVWRILVFEYLFLSHMRVAVPVLLVNLCTLFLSVILGSWIITEIFDIKLAPLLATSAIFSIVLGLAMQDTLGNLFAGVALQFDKPYEIGDWIEVQGGSQKWVGLVDEISWRATILIGWNDEAITIPNRVMGQSQISNYSTKIRPVARGQIFRVPHGSDLEKAKKALAKAPQAIDGIRHLPSPNVIVTEATESWITLKLVYFIDDYGAQFGIADQLVQKALRELEASGVQLAGPRIFVTHDPAA